MINDSWEPGPNTPRKPVSLTPRHVPPGKSEVRQRQHWQRLHIWTALLGILNSSDKERKELGLSHQHSSSFSSWAVMSPEPSTNSAAAGFLVVYTAIFLTWWIGSAVSQKWFLTWGPSKMLHSVCCVGCEWNCPSLHPCWGLWAALPYVGRTLPVLS